MVTKTQLPLPTHYVASRAGEADYHTKSKYDLQLSANEWRKQYGVKPAGSDKVKVVVLDIDQNEDFCNENGTLYVAGQSGTGSVDDSSRIAEFIYREASHITEVIPTMDSHLKWQVFFSSAHVDKDGNNPPEYTTITVDDYRSGKYRANPMMATMLGVDQTWLTRYFEHYVSELARGGRYDLTIWPYHCLIGSYGHKLNGVVEEALSFHSFLRGAANNPEVKGGNPLTEHYSIFAPEVMTLADGSAIPGAQRNVMLLEKLNRFDKIILCGEAASHCLAWSALDLLEYVIALEPKLAEKLYVMVDCTSSVVIPGVVDYSDKAQEAFDKLQNAGAHLVKSTDPMETWPGMEALA